MYGPVRHRVSVASAMTLPRRHWLLLAAVLLLLVVALLGAPPTEWTFAPELASQLEAYGRAGLFALLLFGALATSVGVPRQLLALIGGYAYGWLVAVTIGTLAATLGCLITFAVSRRLLSSRVRKHWPRQVAQLDALLARDVVLKILVLRLQPLGTNMLTNVTAGVTRMPVMAFLGASLVGYLPQMLVFALLGDGIRLGSTTHLAISLVLLGVSLLLGVILYRRHRPGGQVLSMDR